MIPVCSLSSMSHPVMQEPVALVSDGAKSSIIESTGGSRTYGVRRQSRQWRSSLKSGT
uniref:Uncharacterized protein n=1 Tax=Arundo donax TaxID=35708 RepID=A0A0A8ZBS5_ARUDO